MSLTSLIQQKEVKDKLRKVFPKPNFSRKGNILAEPLTKNYGQIGTAFDYLLRFYLSHTYKIEKKDKWVAENGVELLKNGTQKQKLAVSLVNQAKKRRLNYIKNGVMTQDLIESSLHLASLDLIYRIGHVSEKIDHVDPYDVKDLMNLFDIIDPEIFNVTDICVLNPTFPVTSELHIGADCDLFIDGILIDVKTSKHLKFERTYFNQLLGYYFLAHEGGITGVEGVEVTELGIYFSRYSILRTFPTSILTENPAFTDFSNWFIARASIIEKHIDEILSHGERYSESMQDLRRRIQLVRE
jgi:hypothetical protein